MPVLLEAQGTDAPSVDEASQARVLEIGLLNNLSDGGLVGGERQFISLLDEAAGERIVRLKLFSLPEIPRGSATRERIGALYSDLPTLMRGRLDGLIVTGCEPVAARLSDEAYWPALTAVIDWAEHHTVSTIWSCLAAHAAVLHLDGIERRPLGAKRSGIFEFERTAAHSWLAGDDAIRHVPHSRYNDLGADDLVAHGYDILTRSPTAGVDTFIKQWHSLFVYFQGHPEYDGAALAREYRRDTQRFLSGQIDAYPAMPDNYLPREIEARLRDFEMLARIERGPDTMARFPLDLTGETLEPDRWRWNSVAMIRDWLSYLARAA